MRAVLSLISKVSGGHDRDKRPLAFKGVLTERGTPAHSLGGARVLRLRAQRADALGRARRRARRVPEGAPACALRPDRRGTIFCTTCPKVGEVPRVQSSTRRCRPLATFPCQGSIALPGLQMNALAFGRGTAKFDLTLGLRGGAGSCTEIWSTGPICSTVVYVELDSRANRLAVRHGRRFEVS